jgi:hypothetical protein
MKKFSLLVALVVLAAWFGNLAAAAPVRTMHDLPGLPTVILKHELTKDTYAQLSRAPVKAYLVVRGQVVGNVVQGTRVIRTEGNGVYDKAALQLASGMTLYTSALGSRVPQTALVYVLIYQLPKGEVALVLAQDDSAGDTNLLYSRSVRVFNLALKRDQPKPKKK